MSGPLAVLASGLVCGLGLTAEESCTAIRCGINNFQETRFIGQDGEWLIASEVTLEEPWRGHAKLARMAARAIGECLTAAAEVVAPERVPVLLCVAEEHRPGRLSGLDSLLMQEVATLLGHPLHPASRIVPQGRVGGAIALLNARQFLAAKHPRVVVAGVDSYLIAQTLMAYDGEDRLLTKENSNGFIPGEAAGAVLLAQQETEGPQAPLLLTGLGFGREPAHYGSGKPLRAEGLVQAIRAALAEAGIGLQDCDYRIADVSGEQYRFKEAALAITRILRDRKVWFGLWHPADCIGEVGAATLPAMLAMLLAGARKDYLPGPVFLGHLGNDDDKRASFAARATTPQTLALETRAEEKFGQKRRSALV